LERNNHSILIKSTEELGSDDLGNHSEGCRGGGRARILTPQLGFAEKVEYWCLRRRVNARHWTSHLFNNVSCEHISGPTWPVAGPGMAQTSQNTVDSARDEGPLPPISFSVPGLYRHVYASRRGVPEHYRGSFVTAGCRGRDLGGSPGPSAYGHTHTLPVHLKSRGSSINSKEGPDLSAWAEGNEERHFGVAIKAEGRQNLSATCTGPSPGWRHTAHSSRAHVRYISAM
jgi:hypothetical protein